MTIDPSNNLYSINIGSKTDAEMGFVPFTGDMIEVSLNNFFQAVHFGKQVNRLTQLETRAVDALEQVKLYQAMALRSADFADIYNQFVEAMSRWTIVYNAQVAQQALIEAYNKSTLPTLQTARNNLQTAINTYNGINPPTTQSRTNLNNAINAYLNTVTSPVQTYNNTATAYNQTIYPNIPTYNAQRNQFGMPPLIPGDAPFSVVPLSIDTTPFPIPTLPTFNPLSNLGVSAQPPSFASALNLYFQNAFPSVQTGLDATSAQIAITAAFLEILTEVNIKNPGGAIAFIQAQHPILFNTSAGVPQGTGSIIAGMSADSNRTIFERIAFNAQAFAARAIEKSILSEQAALKLNTFFQALVNELATQSGQQLANISTVLPTQSKENEVNLEDVTSALVFGSNVGKFVSSGAVTAGILSIINSDEELASLSLEERVNLANLISGEVNLSLSLLSLSQLALSLKIPGLIAQVLGNVEDIRRQGLDNLLAVTPTTTFNEALVNPLLLLFLKSSLTDLLSLALSIPVPSQEGAPASSQVVEGVSEELPTEVPEGEAVIAASPDQPIAKPSPTTFDQAARAISFALNAVLAQGPFANVEDFSKGLTSQLVNQGIPLELASKLAESGVLFVNREISQPFLSFPISTTAPLSALAQQLGIALGVTTATPSPIGASPAVTGPATSPAPSTSGTTPAAAVSPTQPSGAAVTAGTTVPPVTPTPLPTTLPDELLQFAPPGTVQRDNLLKIYQIGLNNPIYLAALNEALAGTGGLTLIRQFRDALVNYLLLHDFSRDRANQIGDLTANLLAPNPSNDSPLQGTQPDIILSRDALVEELTGYIGVSLQPIVGTGISSIQSQASRIVTDIINAFNDNIRLLKERADEEVLLEFRRRIRHYLRPTIPEYLLKLRINEVIKSAVEAVTAYMSPAETAELRKQLTSPTAAGNVPYKRDIDIRI